MDTYSETMNRWMFPALHTPLFPYWRDVGIHSPLVDVVDYGDKFTVTAELPGFEKEDVDLEVSGFSLEIKAERKITEKSKSKNYLQREILRSSYHRTIQFPQEVTPTGAKASLRNGLLEVEVPKITRSEEKVQKVSIE